MIVRPPHADTAEIGGKAASLAWLAANGYRCPDFDVLDAACWDALTPGERMDRHRRTLRFATDQLSFGLACHELCRTLTEAPLPGVVAEWLAAEPLARLGAPVAVRSSAIGEDGSSSSAAGQYESVLGVADAPALEQAIRDVLVSYYSERAVLYRRAQDIDDEGRLAMGVIVQRLIPAEVSGIAFSIDPVSGSPERIVVEATHGLGPVLVSGEADPDRFYVSRDLGTVEHRIGRKAKRLSYDAASGQLADETGDASDGLCISAEQARAVAHAVRAMHDAVGYAVDVEWALAPASAEPIYLQMRPVTQIRAARPQTALVPTF